MAASAEALYSIRPSFQEKFRPATVKTLIGTVLSEKLDLNNAAKYPAVASTTRWHEYVSLPTITVTSQSVPSRHISTISAGQP